MNADDKLVVGGNNSAHIDASDWSMRKGERIGNLYLRNSPKVGADFSGIVGQSIEFEDSLPIMAELAPRRLRGALFRGRFPTYQSVDFTGLEVEQVDFGAARFVGCRFVDMAIERPQLPIQAHFKNCIFSGHLEANFWKKASNHDSVLSTEVVGNDFSRCLGISFYGGFRWQDNILDWSTWTQRTRADEAGKATKELVCRLHCLDISAARRSRSRRGV